MVSVGVLVLKYTSLHCYREKAAFEGNMFWQSVVAFFACALCTWQTSAGDACLRSATFRFTEDHALLGHTVEEIAGVSAVMCLALCLSWGGLCRSMNYNHTGTICQMNGATKEVCTGGFQLKPGVAYLDVSSALDMNLRCPKTFKVLEYTSSRTPSTSTWTQQLDSQGSEVTTMELATVKQEPNVEPGPTTQDQDSNRGPTTQYQESKQGTPTQEQNSQPEPSTQGQDSNRGPTTQSQHSKQETPTQEQGSLLGPTTQDQDSNRGPTTQGQDSKQGTPTQEQDSQPEPTAQGQDSNRGPTTQSQDSKQETPTQQQGSLLGPTTQDQDSNRGPTTQDQDSKQETSTQEQDVELEVTTQQEPDIEMTTSVPAGCNVNTEAPMGMASGLIADNKITASSDDIPPRLSRINQSGWCASFGDRDRWVQVDFGSSVSLTGVKSWGVEYSEVQTYQVLFGNDNIAWTEVRNGAGPDSKTTFPGRPYEEGITTSHFPTAVHTRYIRIRLVELAGSMACFRFELLGCRSDSPSNKSK
ncbi:uncharacterized protein LOC110988450 [Acanthaster planci]|uniref:Uncharacterized protein LOC110988450 n=1 Tax=Acanthaster planci TaxID=133434 RepID=A0A8B7ZPX5_ACAPL|nr:uncharacterized protein LOC110988450 [Acanthaster planci]